MRVRTANCAGLTADAVPLVQRSCMMEREREGCRPDTFSAGNLECFCRTDYCNAEVLAPPSEPDNAPGSTARFTTIALSVLCSSLIRLV